MFKLSPMASAVSLALACAQTHPIEAFAQVQDPQIAATGGLDRVEVRATRERLDAARNSLSPETGSSTYRFDTQDIANLPLGDATPLNQVLLRAPGVVQDSFGQLHVRGDHANLQYRINGVVIPESISGFGQALDTRFADRVSVLTGALPAQYGYRTAGIVDIHSKGSDLDNGGSVDLIVGSRSHREASAQIGGATGPLSYFVTGAYLQNQIGIENPTPARNAIHDQTRQGKGFAYLSYLLDTDSRLSLVLGASNNRFQIPDTPGKAPSFMLANSPTPASENLDANQQERNQFEVLSYQASVRGSLDYQVSVFHRFTDVHYSPDPIGDLVYNGIAADITRRNDAHGVQADLSKPLGDRHTLRAGAFAQRERARVDNTSQVFAADATGAQTSTAPIQIVDNARIAGHLYGVYLQDEWQPTTTLTINYGTRFDKVSTVVDEQQLSPRLGLVYQIGESTRLHAGYARYFTPPPTEKIDTTTVQKFLGTTNALPSDANTAVKSERSNYYDIGVSQVLTPQLTVGIDAYYRDVRHLQDEGQFGNALIFSAFNYERGKIYGMELSGTYRDRHWSGYVNVGLSSARGKGIETGQFNFDDAKLAYIANHWVHLDHDQTLAVSIGGAYRVDDATSVGVDALYGSGLRSGFANTEHLPGYTQFNGSVSHTFDVGSFGKLDARLSILNLFDRTYQLRDGTGIGVGAPQYGLRRTIYLAIGKPFTF